MNDDILNLIRSVVGELPTTAGSHEVKFTAGAVRCLIPVRSTLNPVLSKSETRAEGDPAEMADGEQPTQTDEIRYSLTGIASSTSVDWYGTEMSRACLDDMAAQFTRGVEVFVGHGSWVESLEWDKGIGITTAAAIEDANVAEPGDATERGAICKVDMEFSADPEDSADRMSAVKGLLKRVRRGLPIGLSIGGWFRSLTYITDEEGYINRVIVNQVELDHLATTRRPANPDCLGLEEVRSALQAAIKRAEPPPAEPAPAPIEVPVVVQVEVHAERSTPEPAPVAVATGPAKVREIDPEAPDLADSKYEQPPHDYVTDIKANWPDIWDAGGNIRGNDAYRLWSSALKGSESEDVLDWIVEREGWAARHFKDFELPGVMAQLKWGVIGEKGWDHQKEVIEARKAEIEAEQAEDAAEGEGMEDSKSEPAESGREAPAPTEPAEPSHPSDRSTPSDPAQSAEVVAPEPASPSDLTPSARSASQQTASTPHEEDTTMTPEQIQALIQETLQRALGTPPAPTQEPAPTQDADQRRGIAAPTAVAEPKVQPPAGANLSRAGQVVRTIINHPVHNADSSDRSFAAEILRNVQFGRGDVNAETAASYREPSTEATRGIWLGLSHELRMKGSDELASITERAAPVLALDLRGARALRKNDPALEADRALADSECRALFYDAVRSAAASGHPTFREPGTREAVTRALTVSATSDKVTTALVSSLLQQLSNIQLGARTQLRRIPGAGTNYQTPNRTVSNTLAEFVADGTAPTEDSGTWSYDTWNYATLATRIKVTRKAQRQGAQWGDILAAELMFKGEDFNRQEEIAIFQGDPDHSLPTASSFKGLLTLIQLTSGQTVANATATAGDVLSLAKLDQAINKVRGREMKANMRIFCSEQGHNLLNSVLQADQMFVNSTMIQAGFVVETYRGMAIVESSGIPDTLVWNGTDSRVTKWTTGATTAIVIANLNHVYMVVLTPVMVEQVAVTTAQYAEYEMFSDEVLVLDNDFGGAILGGIAVS